ncbi:hypothetical protein SAY87_002953 [Trapa incisa]|uniref:Uncharacterized protein n=1 Tax=Trapa incisa TaxID=236973 RepID=A0AAN7KRP7_9MYRT|nr:hypothetical protein SAY87_002953 [Trapa incisa]
MGQQWGWIERAERCSKLPGTRKSADESRRSKNQMRLTDGKNLRERRPLFHGDRRIIGNIGGQNRTFVRLSCAFYSAGRARSEILLLGLGEE